MSREFQKIIKLVVLFRVQGNLLQSNVPSGLFLAGQRTNLSSFPIVLPNPKQFHKFTRRNSSTTFPNSYLNTHFSSHSSSWTYTTGGNTQWISITPCFSLSFYVSYVFCFCDHVKEPPQWLRQIGEMSLWLLPWLFVCFPWVRTTKYLLPLRFVK